MILTTAKTRITPVKQAAYKALVDFYKNHLFFHDRYNEAECLLVSSAEYPAVVSRKSRFLEHPEN